MSSALNRAHSFYSHYDDLDNLGEVWYTLDVIGYVCVINARRVDGGETIRQRTLAAVICAEVIYMHIALIIRLI